MKDNRTNDRNGRLLWQYLLSGKVEMLILKIRCLGQDKGERPARAKDVRHSYDRSGMTRLEADELDNPDRVYRGGMK